MRALYVRQGCLTLPRVASRNPPVCPPQTANGRPAGTLLGSAPAPVAVFAIAPKTVSLLGSTAAPGCRVRRPRRTPLSARPMFPARALATTREGACAPPVRPPQTAIGRCWRTATNWDIAGERARPGLGMGSTAALGCRVRRPRRIPFRPPDVSSEGAGNCARGGRAPPVRPTQTAFRIGGDHFLLGTGQDAIVISSGDVQGFGSALILCREQAAAIQYGPDV